MFKKKFQSVLWVNAEKYKGVFKPKRNMRKDVKLFA